MPDIAVDLIERQLGVGLPPTYRALLLAYPRRLRDATLDLGWKQEPISERQLYGDAGRIVAANVDVRRPGTPWVGDAGAPWPGRMLVVGDDGCGNFWCLDLDGAPGGGDAVYLYDHDAGAFEPDAPSLAAYVAKTIRYVEEFWR